MIVVGLRRTVNPWEGAALRETAPENPLRGMRRIVEFAGIPGIVIRNGGLADSIKSGDGAGLTATLTITL